MAGIAAGVVGAADVNQGPPANGGSRWDLGSPATWSTIWFAASLIYLVGIYMGMFRIRRG